MRKGEAQDDLRAQYAQSMYAYGVKVAAQRRIAVNFEIQGVPVIPSAIFDADVYDPGWQNNAGSPAAILICAQNLVAASPVPDGIYSITVDVLRNAVVPASDTDFIQVGREDLDAILGYAEHLATFKLGGAEFTVTLPLLDSFLKRAAAYNYRISELNEFVLNSLQSLPTAQPASIPLAVAPEES
jgi:hypothetical protein